MKNVLAAATGIMLGITLLADEERFRRALIRWEQRPSLVSALHVATSGFFLIRDVEGLG